MAKSMGKVPDGVKVIGCACQRPIWAPRGALLHSTSPGGNSTGWRNCEPSLIGIKDSGGKERCSLWLPTLCTLCTKVSVFLSGLFLKGFAHFLCLCTFSHTFVCWPLARVAAVLLWLSGRWDFHGCPHRLSEERRYQEVTYKHRPCRSLAQRDFSFPWAVSTWGQRKMPRFLWGLNSVWYSTWHNPGPCNRNVSC